MVKFLPEAIIQPRTICSERVDNVIAVMTEFTKANGTESRPSNVLVRVREKALTPAASVGRPVASAPVLVLILVVVMSPVIA